MTSTAIVVTLTSVLRDVEIPRGVHAEHLSTVARSTNTRRHAIAVWGPAPTRCPGCAQSERPPERGCPVVLDDSHGEPQAWSQQHGCGSWWGPVWEVHSLDESVLDAPDRLAGLIGDMVADVVAATQHRDAADVRDRQQGLYDALADALDRLGEGDDPDDVANGSETTPGVWLGPTGWEAWDYDPCDDSEVIVATGTDLAGRVRPGDLRPGPLARTAPRPS